MPRKRIQYGYVESSENLDSTLFKEHELINVRKDLAMARCVQLDHDCAAIFILSIAAVASGRPFAKQFCELISCICDACADECDRYSNIETGNVYALDCRRYASEIKNVVFF